MDTDETDKMEQYHQKSGEGSAANGLSKMTREKFEERLCEFSRSALPSSGGIA